jgi:hypothetical protein
VIRFKRTLDAQSEIVQRESVTVARGLYRRPFFSYGPESLSRAGFVRQGDDGSLTFLAPDAELLASDWFVETHCFQAVPQAVDTSVVGLAVHPQRRAPKPDIDGILWLDRATAELRSLEMHYTGVPLPVDDARSGAQLQFLRLADGKWIVTDWLIRAPIVQSRNTPSVRVGVIEVPASDRASVIALQEDGGHVQLSDKDPSTAYGSIVGTLLPVQPSQGRRTWVTLAGTERVVFPDSTGAYFFDRVLPGRYTMLAARESSKDEAGAVITANVIVRRAQIVRSDFTLPIGDEGLRAACPSEFKSDKSGVVLFFADTMPLRVVTNVDFAATISRIEGVSSSQVKLREDRLPGRSTWDGSSKVCGRREGEQWTVRIGTDPHLYKLDFLRPRSLEVKLLTPAPPTSPR